MTEDERERLASVVDRAAPALRMHVERDDGLLAYVSAHLREPSAPSLRDELQKIENDGHSDLSRALRILHHREITRIALREIESLADIDHTAREVSALADGLISIALEDALQAQGREVLENKLAVLGMGKLGSQELNLSSDVDIVFVADEKLARDTEGIRHAERAVRATVKLLSEVTDAGFCFRVDLRLRPAGNQGPLITTPRAAGRHYASFGRPWERAALLRSRCVAGNLELGAQYECEVRPFVVRTEIDPSIAQHMADLLERTRLQLKVDDFNVKLSKGGIRELEFFVQILQLVWGGTHPEVITRGTVDAVRRLQAAGLVSPDECQEVEESWAFLRRLEHRIHVVYGFQTHRLPVGHESLAAFSESVGFDSGEQLLDAFAQTQDRVSNLFSTLQTERVDRTNEGDAYGLLAAGLSAGDTPEADAVEALFEGSDPDAVVAHLQRLATLPYSPLGVHGAARHPSLGGALLRAAGGSPWPAQALNYSADMFARLGSFQGYADLFSKQPQIMARVIALFGSSGRLSRELISQPAAIYEVLTSGPPTLDEIEEEHRAIDLDQDTEHWLDQMREKKKDFTIRISLALLAEELSQPDSATLFTALAREQVRTTLAFASAETERKLGSPRPDNADEAHGLCAIAMGKLATEELGFGGDLDVIFVYGQDGHCEGSERTNVEVYTRIVQRTIHLLSTPHAVGTPYALDTRLRPSGTQGTLVVSIRAFDQYHAQSSRPWERQALMRAAPIAGPDDLQRLIRQRIHELRTTPPPYEPQAFVEMRSTIEQELGRETPARLHPKYGYGALLDIEFFVQWQQLQGTLAFRDEEDTPSTLTALERMSGSAIERKAAQELQDAYTFFRRADQFLRLLDATSDGYLRVGSQTASRVARLLRFRDRDEVRAEEAMLRAWKERAAKVRGHFERAIAPLGTRT